MKKPVRYTYIFHRILISIILILSIAGLIFNDDWSVRSTYIFTIAQSAAFLLTTFLPNILRKLHFEIHDSIYIIFILFMGAHFILGEIFGFFAKVTWWDSLLHTFSGVMLTFLSFSLISLMNDVSNKNFRLNTGFMLLFAFCLTLTIGAIWEIVEYTIDSIFGTNMQRAYISLVDGSRGEALVGEAALSDTMKDLILDAVGSFCTCIVCFILYKKRKFNISEVKLITRSNFKTKDKVKTTRESNKIKKTSTNDEIVDEEIKDKPLKE